MFNKYFVNKKINRSINTVGPKEAKHGLKHNYTKNIRFLEEREEKGKK